MKKLIFFACFMAGILVSCSSDLIDSDSDKGSLYNEENAPDDGISFSFRLLNENGEKTSSFKYGDKIMFDFAIKNNCDTFIVNTFEDEEWIERIVRYVSKNGPDMFMPRGREFMCVYSNDGKIIGTPYSSIWCEFVYRIWMTIPSHTTYHMHCPWKEHYKPGDVTYPLCGPREDNVDLPVGNYYVSFSIKYREKANDPDSKFKTAIFKYPFKVV